MPVVTGARAAKAVDVFIGVDPGVSGGLASVHSSGVGWPVAPMPPTDRDVYEWLARVAAMAGRRYCRAMIERVHSMPRDGVASAFKFGTSYGALRMALTAAGIPFEEVSPREWQRGLGVIPRRPSETRAAWKGRLREHAQRLFPTERIVLATADALLIAEYCRRIHGVRTSDGRRGR